MCRISIFLIYIPVGYNADIILSSVKLRESMRGSESEKKGVEKLRRRYKK